MVDKVTGDRRFRRVTMRFHVKDIGPAVEVAEIG